MHSGLHYAPRGRTLTERQDAASPQSQIQARQSPRWSLDYEQSYNEMETATEERMSVVRLSAFDAHAP